MLRALGPAAVFVVLVIAAVIAGTDRPEPLNPEPPNGDRVVSDSITIVPMDVIPELDGVVETLAAVFPDTSVLIAAQQELPADPPVNKRGQIVFEKLRPSLSPTAGTVFVINRDFTASDWNYLFGWYEVTSGSAMISTARMRSADGVPDSMLASSTLSRARFQSQMISSAGKVLGLSFPCEDERCVLNFPNDIHELDLKSRQLCPKHSAEYAVLLAARPDAGDR